MTIIEHGTGRAVRLLAAGLAAGLTATALAVGVGATAAVAAPAAPGKLTAFAGGDSVALLWEAAAGTTARSYTVYRGGSQIATNVAPANPAASVRTVRFYDTAALAAGSYQYQVRMTATDGQVSALSQPVTVTRPATTSPPTVLVENTNPDLTAALAEVTTEVARWYPKFSQALTLPEYGVPSTVTIVVDPDMADDGTIAANNTIKVREGRVKDYATAADRTPLIGTVLHEMTHLMQQYPGGMPDWFIEGVAVYATHRIYHDADTPVPAATQYYTDGYSDTSALLEYVVDHFGLQNLPHELNIALHNGTYTEQFFVTRTGRTLSQLWTDTTGRSASRIKFRTPGGLCLEPYNGWGSGTQLSIATCWDTAYQAVAYRQASGATSGELAIKGLCLAPKGGGRDDGTAVLYVACDGGSAQQWVLHGNGSVVQVLSGKCLQPVGGVDSNKNLVEIRTCGTGTATQFWSRQTF